MSKKRLYGRTTLRGYKLGRGVGFVFVPPEPADWEESMPPKSEAQRKAMHAAAEGKSTIGIPKKVGREFADSDPGGKLPQKKRQKRAGKLKRTQKASGSAPYAGSGEG